ncbi:MAG: ABC transporter permease [Pirellulaceae bacterium]
MQSRVFGISSLLTAICLFTMWQAPEFAGAENLQNTMRWTALFGIISIGVAFVIITGGIDLSIGSVIALIGCLLAMALKTTYVPQDQLEIESLQDSTLQLTQSPTDYKIGDEIRIGDSRYAVQRIEGTTLTTTEVPDRAEVLLADQRRSREIGSLVRPVFLARARHQVLEEKPVDKNPIRRGNQNLYYHTIVVAGTQNGFREQDQIRLDYETGIPGEYSIVSTAASGVNTEFRFLARKRNRLPPPAGVRLSHRTQTMPTSLAIFLMLGLSAIIGLAHGLLITKVRLQPFIVTLCGLLGYRGIARFITSDQTQGFQTEYFQLRQIAKGDLLEQLTGVQYEFGIPMPFVFLAILAIVASVFLNKTIYGRYMLALGRNEEAARFSGINTDRMVILSYVICSVCAGMGGILFAFDLNSILPSGHGNFYELYAIAAAVLGGCSLRGGEGSILGVVIATAVMRVLNNAINLIEWFDTSMEFAIIGLVILLGVTADEMVRRIVSKRRGVPQANQ